MTNTHFKKHLYDLKYHLILFGLIFFFLFTICYFYCNELIYILIKPLLSLKDSNYFIFTDITEIFFIKILLSFVISTIVTLIYNIIQFWFFFSPGLYKQENIKIIKGISFYIIYLLFIINFIYTYFIPNAWNFFITFDNNPFPFLYNIYLEPRIYDYIIFFIQMLLLTIFLFQYPFILFLLFKIIKIENIIKYRNFFYLKIIIICSLITPPDLWSQIITSLIFIFFMELFILIYFLQKNY